MRTFIKNDRGNVLAFAAASIFTLLLFTTMATDIGYILSAQNQLQSAVDSAALAGASGLVFGNTYASYMAIRYGLQNDCMRQPVVILPGDIGFPGSDRIRVQANRQLNTFFLRLLGMPVKNISATAMAQLGYINGTSGLRPLAVPDYHYKTGDRVVIKAGSLGAPATNPSFFYPVDYPAINKGDPISGADQYEENIMYGSNETVDIGDVLLVEPGDKVGPTNQAVDYLISQDPGAYWGANGLAGSSFQGFSSPRIIKLPMYDPIHPPNSGRNTITVECLAAFFVEGMQGNNVIGVFMEITTGGTTGGTQTLLRGVKLVS